MLSPSRLPLPYDFFPQGFVRRLTRPIQSEASMIVWFRRHPILTWAIAWGVTGMGLFISDIASDPRHGPLWASIVFGMLAWAWAGALTFHGELRRRGLLSWGFAYAIAYGLAMLWTWGWSGREGLQLWGTLFVWSLGTASGPLLSGFMHAPRRPHIGLAFLAAQWGLTVFAGAIVGFFGGYFLVAVADIATRSLGNERLLLTLGVALGTSLGGVLVGAAGMTVRDRIMGMSADDPFQTEMP
jgi:hypothetical protein